MGSARGAGIAIGLINGLKERQQERENIMLKRAENQRETELFDLKKQKLENDLAIQKNKGLISEEIYENKTAWLKAANKVQKAKNDMTTKLFSQAENKNMMGTNKIQQDIKALADIVRLQMEVNNAQPNKKAPDRSVNKVLGALSAGKAVDQYGRETVLDTKEKAEAFASQNLGADYKQKYPKAQMLIEKNLNYVGSDTNEMGRNIKGFTKDKPDLGEVANSMGKTLITNKENSNKIKMKAPNGTIGYIDQSKAEEAKRRGFKEV